MEFRRWPVARSLDFEPRSPMLLHAPDGRGVLGAALPKAVAMPLLRPPLPYPWTPRYLAPRRHQSGLSILAGPARRNGVIKRVTWLPLAPREVCLLASRGAVPRRQGSEILQDPGARHRCQRSQAQPCIRAPSPSTCPPSAALYGTVARLKRWRQVGFLDMLCTDRLARRQHQDQVSRRSDSQRNPVRRHPLDPCRRRDREAALVYRRGTGS